MIQRIKHILPLLLLSLTIMASNKSVNGIYYDFDKNTQCATVTFRGNRYSDFRNEYRGKVTIPSTVVYGGIVYQVTSIAEGAFRGCASLREVIIPKSVVHIGMFAFKETAMERDKSNWVDGVMYVQQCVVDALYDNVPEHVVLRSDTRLIADYAFAECENMKSITMTDNVLYIGKMAFALCTALEQFTIPQRIRSIEELTFWACIRLRKINIPASVTSIASGAFGGCVRMDSITIEEHNVSYSVRDNVLFNKDMTELICYPAGIQYTRYVVPSGVRQINGWAFEAATHLQSIELPNGLKYIMSGAFTGCESLVEINIPKSVDIIADEAFIRCFSLKQIKIPKYTKIAQPVGEESLRIVRDRR